MSRLTPGTNVLAYLAALGWTYHRAAGAVVAVAAGSLPGAAIVTAMTAAAATSIAGRPFVPCSPWPRSWPASSCSRTPGRSLRPYVRGARVAWTLASIALAAALALAGATPVRVLLVLAIWGAPDAASPRPAP